MKSRTQRFGEGLAGSYGVIAVGVVYTLVSIPLLLRHISLTELGLWSLSVQFAAYWSYIDFGVSQGLARLLVEEKDNRAGGRYATLFRTAGVVAAAACIASVIGCVASGWAVSHLLKLSHDESLVFQRLYWYAGLAGGIQMVQRRYGSTLLAHQRIDSTARGDMVNLGIMLVTLWVCLRCGLGVVSLAVTTLVGALWLLLYSWTMARRYEFTPRSGEGAAFSRDALGALWRLGREVLVFGLGTQVRNTVAAVALGRWVGMEAVGTWNVCTKAFMLIQQVTNKLFDVGVYPLMELWSRGDRRRIRERFPQIVLLSAIAGGVLACNWAGLNGWFVAIWTNGAAHWDRTVDVLLATWMVLAGIHRCFTNFAGVTKVFAGVRWFPWLEAAVTTVLSFLLAPALGVPGVLIAMIVANLLFEGVAGGLYLEKVVGLSGIWRDGIARAYLIAGGCLGTMGVSVFCSSNQTSTALWATAGASATVCILWVYLSVPRRMRREAALFAAQRLHRAPYG